MTPKGVAQAPYLEARSACSASGIVNQALGDSRMARPQIAPPENVSILDGPDHQAVFRPVGCPRS